MAKFIDNTGETYGRLTVLRRATNDEINAKRKSVHYLCRCDCEKEKIIEKSRLMLGTTVSCGCWSKENNTTHGKTNTPTWSCWMGIKKRCHNPNCLAYPRYGGRGIRLATEWEDFNQFLSDVGERPSDAHSLDRINNNGNYEPGNVRWVLDSVQARNKRNNRFIEVNGVKKLLCEWAEEKKISASRILTRIDTLGWSVEDAVVQPTSHKRIKRR